MKVINSNSISPFGGLNLVIKELNQLGIDNLLNQYLPKLPSQCKYTWKDLIYSFWSIFFCGGDCSEDLSTHLKDVFAGNPYVKVPSPDRVLERMKSLSEPSKTYSVPRGKSKHEISINQSLSRLNLKLLRRISLQKRNKLVLDYDNTLLFTRKEDAAMTYKKEFGYAPGVGIIGKDIVYVENRNGNSAAANLQEDTLERMFELLQEQNINVDKFRADGASYKLSTLAVIAKNVNKFYIRANMSLSLTEAVRRIENWTEVLLGDQIVTRGSVIFTPFEKIAERSNQEHLLSSYRLVVTKINRYDGQYNLFTGEACNYYAILTNDYEMTDNQVIHFYNQRGAIEKEFDVLKNDFGWNHIPFSKLEYNTVFFIITGICRNLYNYIITQFSKRYRNLKSSFRIKKFIFRFICIPAKWIKSGRIYVLRLYGNLYFKT